MTRLSFQNVISLLVLKLKGKPKISAKQLETFWHYSCRHLRGEPESLFLLGSCTGNSHVVAASLSLSLAFCLVSLRGKVGEFGQTDPSTSAGPQAELRAGRKHSKQFTLPSLGLSPQLQALLQQRLEGYSAQVNLVTLMS